MNEERTEKTNERYLSFSLGTEYYAIPLLSVKEVIALPECTPVPFTPEHFIGIVNLRGQVISVIDLRTKFNIKANAGDETAVIICDLKDFVLGVVVDSVDQVLNPNADEMVPRPEIESKIGPDYITSIYRRDNELILFLDIERALSLEDHEILQKNTPLAA